MVSRLLSRLRSPRVQRPVFIVGCGRSGTTLLFQLLRRNPAVVATTGYPDGEDHVGWKEHGQCIISGLGHSSVEDGRSGYEYCLHMDGTDAAPQVIASMHRYYWREVLKGDANRRVINKCPHLSNKLGYVRAIFRDALFVHIIRDCLPVVASWIRMMQEQTPQVLYWPDTPYPCFWVFPAPSDLDREVVFRNEQRIYPGGGVDVLLDYWVATNENIPRLAQDFSSQLITIRFEDLCNNPIDTLNRVAEFCGIPRFEGEQCDDYGRVVDLARNDKFSEVLSEKQIGSFLKRANRARRQFGYVS